MWGDAVGDNLTLGMRTPHLLLVVDLLNKRCQDALQSGVHVAGLHPVGEPKKTTRQGRKFRQKTIKQDINFLCALYSLCKCLPEADQLIPGEGFFACWGELVFNSCFWQTSVGGLYTQTVTCWSWWFSLKFNSGSASTLLDTSFIITVITGKRWSRYFILISKFWNQWVTKHWKEHQSCDQ